MEAMDDLMAEQLKDQAKEQEREAQLAEQLKQRESAEEDAAAALYNNDMITLVSPSLIVSMKLWAAPGAKEGSSRSAGASPRCRRLQGSAILPEKCSSGWAP